MGYLLILVGGFGVLLPIIRKNNSNVDQFRIIGIIMIIAGLIYLFNTPG